MGLFDKFKKKKEAPKKASVAKKVTKKAEKEKKEKASGSSTSSKKRAKKKKKASSGGSLTRLATKTLIKPVVTEKTAQLSDENVIVFKVAMNANRVTVRQAFRELYKVTPVKVNIINVRGKNVRFGRLSGRRSDYKKALIFLPDGVHVDIFEGV